MDSFKIAILGCGTVGGGVAKIILNNKELLSKRAGRNIEISRIIDLFPVKASQRHNIPLDIFSSQKDQLSKEEIDKHIQEVIEDKNIDLIVETIGGSSEYILNIALNILKAKKHLVTANKALLAKYGKEIFDTAEKNSKAIGFEASVCGAIPVIKGINECLTGDIIQSISGIMNGTSNYILTKMNLEKLSFEEALKQAQEKGYAEADPTLDINGGDAAHKLIILLKIVFGLNVKIEDLPVIGIDKISFEDIKFANEINTTIKLICFAKKTDEGVYATVRPMMVRNTNLLSDINFATNAVKISGLYSQENIFIGQGAGSLETGSAIVSDIVFISKYGNKALKNHEHNEKLKLLSFDEVQMPYNIIFYTTDKPGITGIITTEIGNQNINIDTVSHNIRNVSYSDLPQNDKAIFSVATMPCRLIDIKKAIDNINSKHSEILLKEPKIIPILT